MNLWSTAVQSAVQATVYAAFTLTVGWILKRIYRRRKTQVDRIADDIEQLVSTTITLPSHQKGSIVTFNFREYRKAFAAGLGVILAALLTWVSSDGVIASLLEPFVPDALKPLVGTIAGGLALIAGVILARNDQPTTDAPIAEAAPAYTAEAVPAQAPVIAASTTRTTDPFWQGVTATGTSAPTSRIDLAPVPTSSPL